MQSEAGSPSENPNKSRKLTSGTSASSSTLKRARRAARGGLTFVRPLTLACERCRSSKLRCEAPEPSSFQTKCTHCLKMDLVCEYTTIAPSPVISTNPTVDNPRLEALENLVAQILTNSQPESTPLSALADFADNQRWDSNWQANCDPPPTIKPPIVSPDAPSDGSHDISPSQARPIPKVLPSTRMAAFTEASSHEAPFRSLAYNPDTFRNAEFSRAASEERQEVKTPKRGGGDPIDRGVFSLEEARELFEL